MRFKRERFLRRAKATRIPYKGELNHGVEVVSRHADNGESSSYVGRTDVELLQVIPQVCVDFGGGDDGMDVDVQACLYGDAEVTVNDYYGAVKGVTGKWCLHVCYT